MEKRPKRKHNEDKSKKSQASQSSQEEEELSLTSNSQDSTPETRYSKRACQTPFVYYIQSFTISRQSISIKSHEGSWVLFTISRILLYRGLLYRVSGVILKLHLFKLSIATDLCIQISKTSLAINFAIIS